MVACGNTCVVSKLCTVLLRPICGAKARSTVAAACAGARHHGVAQEYRDWLDSIPAFDNTSVSSRLGAVALAPAVGLGIGMAITESVWGSSSGKAGNYRMDGVGTVPAASGTPARDLPSGLYDVASTAANVMWTAHDVLLAPLLGKGV